MAVNREGTTYFITGGASGLGLATAKLLVSQGANVAIGDKDVEAGKRVEGEVGSKLLFVPLDVTDRASCESAIAQTVTHFKGLSGVINCAGVVSASLTVDKKLKAHEEKYFDLVTKINLYGTFYCSSEGAAAMAKLPPDADGQRGVIINVASVAGIEGQKGQLAYSASKGGVIGMTLPMSRDLARFGIRVMCVAPGIIDTPMMQSLPPKVKQGLLDQVAGPKRGGKAEEFALLATQIIDNGYLNGAVVRLDAGIRFANL
eukprot:CAMPEP_0194532666 /NCGR_PEP_ID=MMETSP0253-20130528/70292_1 /TAXON_ID=2966 /ORGANISM="Noctiluca scintillans" /LENGTH=258 /DNA_ID=CAMNT_0039378137 /DNA_START=53 /DNA_END=829 /DNA_ORIENTATION=+